MRISVAILLLIAICGCESEIAIQSGNANVDNTSSVAAKVEHAALDFTNANFESRVLQSSKVVLVDCWAPW